MNAARAAGVLGKLLFTIALWMASLGSVRAQALLPADKVESGRKLFLHVWEPGDELSVGGDGIGPMHNERSCTGCHHMGGIGGAGGQDKNVDLLSFEPPRLHSDKARQRFGDRLVKFHVGFGNPVAPASNVVLHRFSTDFAYDVWRSKLLGIPVVQSGGLARAKPMISRAALRRRGKKPSVERLPKSDGIAFVLSHRSTPSLFGAGQIDSIPAETLNELARQQAEGGHISGRVGTANQGGAGRFGWRGQTATLRQFVFGACANELGLQVPKHDQPLNPLVPAHLGPGLDLDELQVDSLVIFVASLPPPSQIEPHGRQSTALIQNARSLFNQVGCTDCHVANVGWVEGIYSDLLLHDMGPGLSDPVAANPEKRLVGQQFIGSGGYSGGALIDMFAEVASSVQQEWRTPPLWGARDSAPYLHDGRAATIEDAIALHGGEGARSAELFLALPGSERDRVVAYVNTLGAPAKE